MKTISLNTSTTTLKYQFLLFTSALLLSVSANAQSLFDKFEDKPNVGSVILNQKMFRMLATMGVNVDDPEMKDYANMANNISSFKVFSTDNAATAAEMKATVETYLKSSNLEELMRVKDDGKIINFYVKEGKDENHVKELLMFSSGLGEITKNANITLNGKKREIKTILLTLTGDIDLRQVSKISDQMDLPGGNELKKATKK